MAHRIVVGTKYKKQFRKVRTPEHLARIKEEYADILADPTRETKPLKGELGKIYRYRRIVDTVPQYRILFAVHTCGLESGSMPPFCELKYCEVGNTADEDEVAEWIAPDEQAAEDAMPEAPEEDGPCQGLIKFALFGTREFFENFYNLPAKQQAKLL